MPVDRVAETPTGQDQPSYRREPGHPRAGNGGIVLDERFLYRKGQPSPKPGGKPKGFDPRAVLRAIWARGADDDCPHGDLAIEHAERIIQAVVDHDTEALECELKLLHEISGKPLEVRESVQRQERKITVVKSVPQKRPELPK